MLKTLFFQLCSLKYKVIIHIHQFYLCISFDCFVEEHSPRNSTHVYSREFQSMLNGLDEEGCVEESGGHVTEKKRRLSGDQVKALEKNFEVENKLEPERKVKLAQELGLQPRQVAVWFQNRRARWKTKQLERDYGVLKANYDSLKHSFDAIQQDNEALLKEVYILIFIIFICLFEPEQQWAESFCCFCEFNLGRNSLYLLILKTKGAHNYFLRSNKL